MIDELLNRDNVLRLAREVAARSAAEPEPALESLRSLQAAAKSFATEVPHGGTADAEDREAFLPSDPTLSLFEVILRDRRFAAQVSQDGRPTSEFQLVGKHWQIVGLDSAWKLTGSGLDDLRGHAGHVSHGQVQWLTGAASGGPPAILLSHHQPLSRKTAGGGIVHEGNLFEQTGAVRRSPGLGAWFWGHEHRCMTYGAREGIGYAACVGHGAIPSAPRGSSAQTGEWELTDTWTDAEGKQWRKCGFAILDFSSATTDVQVRYVDHRGRDSKPPECFGVPPGRASPDQGPNASS